MGYQITLEKNIELDDFEKISFSPIIETLINKYINGDFKLTKEEINQKYLNIWEKLIVLKTNIYKIF